MSALAPVVGARGRRAIVHRTRGRRAGPIVRLIDPSDLGQRLKPFVFLDAFDVAADGFAGFGLHPHSGIATVTVLLEGRSGYEDTEGRVGVLESGGVEWMRAGGGAWHAGGPTTSPRVRGFQLWLALPPHAELGPSESVELAPEAVPVDGPVRVLLGRHGAARAPLDPPMPVDYLLVRLAPGERWTYGSAPGHDVCWAALARGRATANGDGVEAGECVVFESSTEPVEFVAETDVEFVLGSAPHHPYDLVLGRYSVHTNAAALDAGERRIRALGVAAKRSGRFA